MYLGIYICMYGAYTHTIQIKILINSTERYKGGTAQGALRREILMVLNYNMRDALNVHVFIL